jgi:hypothetical protein
MSRQKETIPSSSILREAVANGEIELVKDLLNEGADLQTQDQVMIDGNLPLLAHSFRVDEYAPSHRFL